MIIEIEDYKLIQDGTTFNLVWVTKSEETIIEEVDGRRVRTKTGKLVDRDVDFGYNMQLEYCIHKIVMNNLSQKDLRVNLEKWINMYREEREKITKLINNQI